MTDRVLPLAEADLGWRFAFCREQERIARDLHDTVIERLFAVSCALHGVASLGGSPEQRERIGRAIADLDQAMADTRTIIFDLESADAAGLGTRVLDVVADVVPALGFEPAFRFEGDLDDVDGAVSGHLLSTLREALSNVARHARASGVEITLRVGDRVVLEVRDDGVGARSLAGGLGIRNMVRRAALLGGHADVSAPATGGTVLTWDVPLSCRRAAARSRLGA